MRLTVHQTYSSEPHFFHHIYQRLILWRFFIVSLLLVLALSLRWFFNSSGNTESQFSLLVFIAIEYVLTLVYIFGDRIARFKISSNLLSLTLIIDLGLTSWLILYSGGIESKFWVLFAFTALASAGLLPRLYASAIVLYCVSFPPVVALLHWFALWIPGDPLSPNLENLRTLSILAAYNSIFVLIGSVFAIFLAKYNRQTRAELVEKQQDVAYLNLLRKLIVDTIPSGIVVVDNEDNIINTNHSANSILMDSLQSSVHKMLAPHSKSSNPRHEIELRNKNGSFQTIGYSTAALTIPAPGSKKEKYIDGTLLVFQDLTSRREMEQQLQEHEKLVTLGRLGSNLAHEIRNPLTAISNVIQMFEKSFSDLSLADNKNQARDMLHIASKELNRLEHLLASFLAYSNPKALSNTRAVTFSPAAEISATAKLLCGDTPVNLVLDETIELVSYRDAFVQIIENTLLNALQWANPDSPQVLLKFYQNKTDIVFEIHDNGPGVAEDSIDTIWEPFVSSRAGGTGLGLAVSSKIVHELGGTIHAEVSPELGGAMFSILLPSPSGETG